MSAALPPLPEWSKRDDLGGLVPSEIRSALREYARQAVYEAQDAAGATGAPTVGPAPPAFVPMDPSPNPLLTHLARLQTEAGDTLVVRAFKTGAVGFSVYQDDAGFGIDLTRDEGLTLGRELIKAARGVA
jgi:hypothetical protein